MYFFGSIHSINHAQANTTIVADDAFYNTAVKGTGITKYLTNAREAVVADSIFIGLVTVCPGINRILYNKMAFVFERISSGIG